jgi:hypothetical protein
MARPSSESRAASEPDCARTPTHASTNKTTAAIRLKVSPSFDHFYFIDMDADALGIVRYWRDTASKIARQGFALDPTDTEVTIFQG